MPVTTRAGASLLSIGQGNKEASINSALNTFDLKSALLDLPNDGELALTDAYLDALFTGTANPLSGMVGLKLDKNDKTSPNSLGISLSCEGVILWEGMALDYDTNNAGKSADAVVLYDSSVLQNEVQLVTVGTNTAGQFKLTYSAQQTADIAFTAAAATIQTALEALSNIAPGDVSVIGNAGGPWLVEFTGTYAAEDQPLMTLANGTTPLSGGSGQGVSLVYNGNINGNAGADVLRASRYADATGTAATKFQSGAPAGTARTQAEFWLFNAPKNLSAASFRFYDDAGTYNVFNFANQSVTKKRCMVNFQNLWQLGPDYQNTNAEDFYLVDSNRAAGPLTRLFVSGSGGLVNNAGVNTTAPLAYWWIQGTNDATFIDAVQTYFGAGYSSLSNRCMQFQQLVGASQATNFLWFMGTLDAASTQALPKSLSIGPVCHGIQSDQSVMSLISAPTGVAQTISPVVSIGSNTLSFFGSAVSAKAAITGSRGGVAALASLLAELAAKGLVTDSSTA